MRRVHPPLVAGGLYHVTSRGVNRGTIFRDEFDYLDLIRQLAAIVDRFTWRCHSFCLLPNHYHLLVETPEPNLAGGMHLLNGNYARRFNARYARVGHLFQGPYHGEFVEHDEHLLETYRYIALNPVRAGLVFDAIDWPWGSYGGTFTFVDLELTRGMFGSDAAFRKFVRAGRRRRR